MVLAMFQRGSGGHDFIAALDPGHFDYPARKRYYLGKRF
jgi:hypothetical protein